jgi:fructose-bisphosphate aldolase, class II
MKTLREILEQAENKAVAIGHFNVSDLVTLKAVFESAREMNVPVIVGASEGERKFMGVRQISAMVESLRDEFGFPIFLNADHTHSVAGALEAAKAGYDWIVFDASSQPFEQNLRQTKEAVEILKSIRTDILVEGEIGDIGAGSEIHDLANPALTTPVEAAQFVAETRVDTLAPAVGNMHGMSTTMAAGETRKRLDVERIRAIKSAARIFMTLHGASGTDDNDMREAISAGITVVHINTELRLAWRHGLESALMKAPDEIVPYKLLPQAVHSIKQVVTARLALFSSSRIARTA